MRPAPSCATPANPARHQRHRPEETTLYRIVQSHLNPFLAFGDTQTGGSGLPTFVTDECDAFLASGILADLPVGSAKRRMRWAQLLKRVFDIDIERCPHCGGQLKPIAAIENAAAIARILTHLGLAAQPPPRACETGGSVSGGVRCKTGLDFDRAGGGVRTALGQTLRWSGIQARCVRNLSARLREPWVFRGCARV